MLSRTRGLHLSSLAVSIDCGRLTYLFNLGELRLHAFDGDKVVGFDGLRLQYF